jgi:hypothetical protein
MLNRWRSCKSRLGPKSEKKRGAMTGTQLRAHLFNRTGARNAQYVLELKAQGGGYVVAYGFGKIGRVPRFGLNKDTQEPVAWAVAAKAYNRTLAEKVGEGYTGEGQDSFAGAEPDSVASNGMGEPKSEKTATQRPMTFGIGEGYQCELLTEISDAEALRFIRNPDYIVQMKEDGDRRGIMKKPSGVICGLNRKGQPVMLDHELAEAYKKLNATSFLIDGEILPAPTYSVVWDILEKDGEDLRQKPYSERLAILSKLIGEDRSFIQVVMTWTEEQDKMAATVKLHETGAEGIVLKKKAASWRPGRAGQHYKLKFWKAATCRVAKKTVAKHIPHNSCALELFDGKRWILVGHTSLNGKPAVKVGDLVEVKYLYYDNQLYQPELLRVRDDLDESAATMEQLKRKGDRRKIA